MKVLGTIIRYVLVMILTVALISIAFINIITSTILNKEYVLSKLDETDYYKGIYQEIQSNFENYVGQSGLDEDIMNDILTEEKVKTDVDLIISNIYDGTNKTIDTTEIRTNLNRKIENSIDNPRLLVIQRDAIDTFIDTICNEYTKTIIHTKYEQNINNIYVKVVKYIKIAKQALLITIIIVAILICLICYKNIFKGIASLGVGATSTGVFYIITNIFINTQIKINTITILNSTISNSLRNIIDDFMGKVEKCGFVLLAVGIVLIILGNLFNNRKREAKGN